MSRAIFTICSLNYFGQAQTLMRSVREHEPEAARYVVVVDRKSGIPLAESGLADIIWYEELGIDDCELKALTFNVIELNTNVKPTAIRHLLEKHEQCVYLDPDILVYAPLAPVWEGLASSNVVLTPHVVEPCTEPSYPWGRDFLQVGGCNLGFIGVRASAESNRFLRWWENRCLTCGFYARVDGFFVDQKFIDHALVYFDGLRVLRHKGLNVAWWNWAERTLRFESGIWRVDDEPLIFIHFSGFIFRPEGEQRFEISKSQSTVSLRTQPQLAPLLDQYRQGLEMSRYAEFIKMPYTFGSFDNGVPVSQLARRLVGVGAVEVGDRSKPFDSNGPIYKALRKIGALDHARGSAPAYRRNTQRELAHLETAQRLLKWALPVLGVNRYEAMLRFFSYAGSTLNQGFLSK
jgi:hypothetical protein